jgi:Flp pilus assembly protein TadD
MTRRTFAQIAVSGLSQAAFSQDRKVKPESESVPQPHQAIPQSNGRRTALLIGNNNYKKVSPLRNANHDASDISVELRNLRFDVTTVLDTDLITLRQCINRFSSKLQMGDVVFFFYSGHGVQVSEENYLVPTDFNPVGGEDAVRSRCVPAHEVQDSIQKRDTALCILVLDACRNNPFGNHAAKGLAMMDTSLGTYIGTYIGLAAGPGQTASDNSSERNGLFTKFLLKEITHGGQSLDQVFGNVKKQVFEASNQRQRPWLHSDIIGDFYFKGGMRPSPGSLLLESGKRQFQQKQFDQARQSFEQAMRLDPENAFIYNALGAAYAQLRQWSIATGLFAKAIELKPDYAEAYFNRGVAYHNAGRYELAIQDFSWAVDEEPYDPLALDLRGKTYLSLLDYQSAKTDFDRALELNPSDSIALLGRGKAYFRQGKYSEAIRDLTGSLAIHRTSEAYELRSQAYRAMGRTAQAELDHQSAIQLER